MTRLKRPMALLLCLCLVLGMLPGLTAPAAAMTIPVPAGGNIQNAIDAAHDGDTITLQGGYTGRF